MTATSFTAVNLNMPKKVVTVLTSPALKASGDYYPTCDKALISRAHTQDP